MKIRHVKHLRIAHGGRGAGERTGVPTERRKSYEI